MSIIDYDNKDADRDFRRNAIVMDLEFRRFTKYCDFFLLSVSTRDHSKYLLTWTKQKIAIGQV